MTPKPAAGARLPEMSFPRVGGGDFAIGQPDGDHDWQMLVVYRGKHCPICKGYLQNLDTLRGRLSEAGVDVVTLSCDPEEKARATTEEWGLSLPVGYGLTPAQATQLGLYVSDPRSPQETDRPFAEPGLFVTNADGTLQIVDVSNAPFARPDLERVASGIEFIRENDYPIRGRHAA